MKWLLTATCLVALSVGAAGCGGSGKQSASTTARTTRTTTSGYGVGVATGTTIAQIAAARRSDNLFKLFPARTASVSCNVPRGGPYSPGKMTLPGTCSTRVRYTQGPQATVVFSERWHQPGGSRWWQHTWEVVVSSHAKVLSTTSHGAPPPYLWS